METLWLPVDMCEQDVVVSLISIIDGNREWQASKNPQIVDHL